MSVIFGIRAADEHATIVQEHGFRVVETSDGRVGHDSHALTERQRRVVEQGVEVRITRKPETGLALLGTVYDEKRSIRESRHARDDTLARHALNVPLWISNFWRYGCAVIKREALVRRAAATDKHAEGRGVWRVLRKDD